MVTSDGVEPDGSLGLGGGLWLVLCSSPEPIEEPRSLPAAQFLLIRGAGSGEPLPTRLGLAGSGLRVIAAAGWESSSGPAVALLRAPDLADPPDASATLVVERDGEQHGVGLPPVWVERLTGGEPGAPA